MDTDYAVFMVVPEVVLALFVGLAVGGGDCIGTAWGGGGGLWMRDENKGEEIYG